MVALPRSGAVVSTVVALGLISGLPAGPIMSLPARILQPPTRAIGMGIFYTVYYIAMMLGPVVGGACAKWAGSAGGGLRFRRRRDAGVSGAAVGVQSDSGGCAEGGVIAPRATAANHSLTLPAVGSDDTEKPVVGWRRWR